MNRYPSDEEITLNKIRLPKKEKGIVYIYELIDPRDMLPKYIGYTVHLRTRYIDHIKSIKARREKYTKKKNWITHLLRNNLYPFINILDKVPENEWSFWEEYWEDVFRYCGFELKNSVKCGRGPRGLKRGPKTDKEKEHQSNILKEGYQSGRLKHPHKGKPMSDEQREILRRNTSFRRLTKEDIKRRAEINKNRKHKRSPEQKEKMYEGQLKQYLSKPEYRCFVQLNMEENYISSFLTPKIAASEVYGSSKKDVNICKVLSGHAKYALGFKWRKGTMGETKQLLIEKGFGDILHVF